MWALAPVALLHLCVLLAWPTLMATFATTTSTWRDGVAVSGSLILLLALAYGLVLAGFALGGTKRGLGAVFVAAVLFWIAMRTGYFPNAATRTTEFLVAPYAGGVIWAVWLALSIFDILRPVAIQIWRAFMNR